MDYFEIIKERLLNSSPEQIFAFDEQPEWIWVNQTMFLDMVYNLGIDIPEEEEFDLFDHIEQEKIFNLIEVRLKKIGYIRINQHFFAKWEKGFIPTEDIETIIFVRRDYYNKIGLYFQRKYEWLLKAMAIDAFFKVGGDYSSLKECYEDNFSENFRIIEDLMSLKTYRFFAGSWEFVSKDNTLLFIKEGQLMNVWAEGQAESFFNEMIK